jgi:hypothetical protein
VPTAAAAATVAVERRLTVLTDRDSAHGPNFTRW